MAVTVIKYGVHHSFARHLPEVLIQQLRMGHHLRNDLVRVSLDREQALKDLWSSYPQVAHAESAVETAEQRLQDALEAQKAAKVAQRTRAPKGPTNQEVKDARAAARTARQERRDAISRARTDAKPHIAELYATEKAAVKDLYRQRCTEGTLFWATFNTIVDRHKESVKRVAAARGQGRPATLRFKRWDSTGRIAVQLQRGKSAPARTPATIADGERSPWRNVLTLPWMDPDEWDRMSRAQQRHAGRVTARVRCGATHDDRGGKTPVWVDVPIQMHRMLPADADITNAELVISRTGPTTKAHLCVTARVPDPEPVTTGPTVAVHLGWHHADAGTVVATWAADRRLDVDPLVRDVLTCDPGQRTGTITVPDTVLDRITAGDKIRARRDLDLDGLRAEIVEWLTAHGPLDHPTRTDEDGKPEQVTAARVAQWRSPARFAALAIAWRDHPPAGAGELAERLESWRRADKRAWDTSEHARVKATRHRDDRYKRAAADLAAIAGRVVVDDTSVADLARADRDVDQMGTTGLPGSILDEASARRAHTAPGALRASIVAAATREGVPVVTVPAKGLSTTCHRCGKNDPAARAGRIITCACGATWDPDQNAVALMLTRAREG